MKFTVSTNIMIEVCKYSVYPKKHEFYLQGQELHNTSVVFASIR
jgi:hypothetical protein